MREQNCFQRNGFILRRATKRAFAAVALVVFIAGLRKTAAAPVVPLPPRIPAADLRILSLSDAPDPFSPNQDGRFDTNTLHIVVAASASVLLVSLQVKVRLTYTILSPSGGIVGSFHRELPFTNPLDIVQLPSSGATGTRPYAKIASDIVWDGIMDASNPSEIVPFPAATYPYRLNASIVSGAFGNQILAQAGPASGQVRLDLNPQPVLAAYSSSTSVFPGEAISFHVPVASELVPPVTMRIRERRIGPDWGALDLQGDLVPPIVISPSPSALPPDRYAVGCNLPAAATIWIPRTPSGLYVATLVDSGATPMRTTVPFVVKGPREPPPDPPAGSQPRILVVIPVATFQAYNSWGGASLYSSACEYGTDQCNELRFIHHDNYITFTNQVSFDRPWVGWAGNLYPFSDFEDLAGLINRFEATVEPASIEYATSVDLHSDPELLSRYNLLISVGHDEYWSKEMRDNVENFIAGGGNVAFFGANTCWWQVRFERRAPVQLPGGTTRDFLLSPNDPRSMVCYKMEGNLNGPLGGDYSRDPMFASDLLPDPTRITSHWFVCPVNNPENRMTGVSFRNGAYLTPSDSYGSYPSGMTAEEYNALAYTAHFENHWVFQGTDLHNGSTFGHGAIAQPGNEMDAAVFGMNVDGFPEATGEDGTPLNFLILADATVPHSAVPNQNHDGDTGSATMGVYRNNGVVFHAGTLTWRYAAYGDPAVRKITENVLLRLQQRGPWKFEEELHNAYFENWSTPSSPDDWIVEGRGRVYQGRLAPPTGNHSLEVDAALGRVLIIQDFVTHPPLWLERFTRYQVGVFVKASAPGAARVYLESSSGQRVAMAENRLVNEWEQPILAVGQDDVDGPMFGAHVVMEVREGEQASFSDVSVWEVATPATFAPGPITR